MHRSLTLFSAPGVALAVALGGCAAPGGDLAGTEQPIFSGDLGGALGIAVAVGSTFTTFDGFSLPCGGLPSPDDSYTWTAPATGPT